MKPIIILPPNVVSDDDIKLLRENDLCVVVAADPATVKFVDPIPAISSRTEIENAAIQLSRKLLNGQWSGNNMFTKRGDFAGMFVDILVRGTPLDSDLTQAEQAKRIFDTAKADELRRLAREGAKAERAAKAAGKKSA